MNSRPFDDFRALLDNLPQNDSFNLILAKKRIKDLIYPQSSLQLDALGVCNKILNWYMPYYDYEKKPALNPIFAFYAGSQEVFAEKSKVKDIIINLQTGGGLLNFAAQQNAVSLKIYDLAVEMPVSDPASFIALEEKICAATMAYGMEAIEAEPNLLILGGLPSEYYFVEAIISALLFKGEVKDWLDAKADETLRAKAGEILQYYGAGITELDCFDILSNLGNRQLLAMFGAILAARMQNIPVILDGYTAILAAALLYKLKPDAISHCIVGQISIKGCYSKLLQYLSLDFILDLHMEQDYGAGSLMAVSMLRSLLDLCNKGHDFSTSRSIFANYQANSVKQN